MTVTLLHRVGRCFTLGQANRFSSIQHENDHCGPTEKADIVGENNYTYLYCPLTS